MIDQEKSNENPVALSISELKLIENKITLSIPLMDDDFEYDEYTDLDELEKINVDVDINHSAFSNARSFYDAKKVAVVKEQKTIAASKQAFASAEKKIMATLEKKSAQQPSISKARIAQWYEPFFWFITTENYLVIGGRDTMQNEQLLTRYFKAGDILLHADMDNSPIVLIKNIDKITTDIPQTSLQQASTLVICHSKAWEGKIVSSAFWLAFDQVSKMQSGAVLAPGLYKITGSKNWLPPVQLNYGVALGWEIDEKSLERHKLERRPWMRAELQNQVEYLTESTEYDHKEKEFQNSNDFANIKGLIEEIDDVNLDNKHNEIDDFIADQQEIEHNEAVIVDNFTAGSNNSVAGTLEVKGKARMSAKERRKLKKGSQSDVTEPSQRIFDTSSITSNSNSASNLPRGKKSKLKKMKEKYGDQDEEDRKRMMAKIDAKKTENLNELKTVESTPPIREPRPKKDPKLVLEESASFEVPATNLDHITFQPHPEDTLIACIPVCAPWAALQKAKYKVKLVPGSLKKGKSAKQVQHLFQIQLKKVGDGKEVELFDYVPEVEWINATLAKSKPK